ncbi:MAG: glycosyltransferase family 2 protein [Bryobacterales bacterium]|nr:glycosyltransferase family 2 protein [Bryobacterales bacterium]
MISVVIPYFQREAGVLRRTLESVLAQEFRGGIRVIVVDDSSPVPARLECAGLSERADVELRIVEQPNGGVSAARNTGIAYLPAATRYVTFLDSDDALMPDHLARAWAALENGCDAYMGNWLPVGLTQDAYSQFSRVKVEEHEPSSWEPDCRLYRGNFFLQELSNPIGRISTLVVRWSLAKELRFHRAFRCSCEDTLYRLELSRLNPRVAFSPRVCCDCGFGVNQYHSRRFGTVEMFDAVGDRIVMLTHVLRHFELSEQERAAVRRNLRENRRVAVLNAASLLRSGRTVPSAALKRLLGADVRLPLAIPGVLWRWAGS